MARRRGAAFQGVQPPDAGRGSSIFQRWLAAVADDAGYLYDRITGQNGTVDPVNHGGGGTLMGAPIALPLAQQEIRREVFLVGGSKSPAPTYFLIVPVFVPNDGIQTYRLEVSMNVNDELPIFLDVRDSSWAAFIDSAPASLATGFVDRVNDTDASTGAVVHRWEVNLGPGVQYLGVWGNSALTGDDGRLLANWSLVPVTGTGSGAGAAAITGSAVGNPIPVSSMSPTGWVDVYDEQVGNDGPLDAFVITRLNRQINAMLEFVMGGPVPGNNTYSAVVSRRNDRVTFTNEAIVETPVVCLAFGAVERAGSPVVDSLLTSGMTDWFAPQVAAGTTPSLLYVGGEAPAMRPRAVSGTTRARVLAASTTGTPTACSATVNGSAAASFVRLGTSNFYEATISSVPGSGGATSPASVRISKASAIAFGELSVVGVVVFVN